MTYAKESGHWYTREGLPAYEVPYADPRKGMRKTTLRDAKKLDLLPSVTTIMAEAAKPGLENWKIAQNILAALTLTRGEKETDDSFVARVREDAKQHAKQAAEKGKHVHGVIDTGLSGGEVPAEDQIFVDLARNELDKHFPGANWKFEKSFAVNSVTGYGGKVDLHDKPVIDIKTNEKDLEEKKNLVLYDEHLMQLAGYCAGLGKDIKTTPCGILFVSHKYEQAVFVQARQEDIIKGYQMFMALKDFYYAKKQLGAKK